MVGVVVAVGVGFITAGLRFFNPYQIFWGRGADPPNDEAVRRVFEIKRRNDSKALISLVDSEAKVQFYVPDVPDVAWDMMELAERPMTIVFDRVRNLAPSLLAADGSAALRVTRETFSRELCRRFKRAVVSTSANFSGEASPACFDDINPDLLALADYVVRSRRDEKAPARPSSVVKLGADGTGKILRE
ncbi:MAG: L-threonylcarbamoyladenylate synthase [Bacteroidales bacterium]